jgi:hypothetical protein
MLLIDQPSLAFGKTLVDYAFSGEHRNMDLKLSEVIGVVAAYIGTGRSTNEIEETLSTLLSPVIAKRAHDTFEMFNDPHGRGLWVQGPASDDIRFTDRKLHRRYPQVSRRYGSLMSMNGAALYPDTPF